MEATRNGSFRVLFAIDFSMHSSVKNGIFNHALFRGVPSKRGLVCAHKRREWTFVHLRFFVLQESNTKEYEEVWRIFLLPYCRDWKTF